MRGGGAQVQEYVRLARIAAQKINGRIPNEVETFYSLENLKEYLHPEQQSLDVTPINGRYKIFDPTNEKSREYLSVLLQDGTLSLPTNERWSSNGAKGPRGGSILKQIAHEIRYAFKELNLWEPDVHVNHGQGTMTIGTVDKEMLDEITTKLYQLHSNE